MRQREERNQLFLRAVRATAEIFDVNAGTTEQETDKRIQAAKEATDTVHLAVQQSADAVGKSAPRGDYPSGVQIPIVSYGSQRKSGPKRKIIRLNTPLSISKRR